MQQILSRFRFEGSPVSCEPYGEGHINQTFLVCTSRGRRYILQRLSRAAFADIPGLMENVEAVTAHLARKSDDPRTSLHLIPTVEHTAFYKDERGEYWRAYDFVEGSLCLQKAESAEDFRQSAVAFGRFQRELRDFPAETLHETIPDFHNTPDRYRKFRDAIREDRCGRAAQVQREIDLILEREARASELQRMRERGELPLRVTHNDTKLNNVLLDAGTRTALCVIDLDTVMPGITACDFGDSIRFGASTGAEDEQDLDRIGLDLGLYEVFANAFVPACGGLEEAELYSLPLGAFTMTLENGMRFLTDYLEGDHYYHIARPEHNLDRCRTQLKLMQDMERKWDRMVAAVKPGNG